jgi:erythronate-4-phosphate dehydrogenase
MPKIVVDENIALGKEAFSVLGEVTLMPGRKIDNKSLMDAEALVVRSITNVNSTLLEGTPVKFVGTATIGTDHVDAEYLESRGIKFADAKGCNADAVTEYVFAALFNILSAKKIEISNKLIIGIVGVGNIGSRVAKIAEVLGMNVLKNDPPLERIYGSKDFVSLEEILGADIITLHVPLNMEGEDKTYHLTDEKKLSVLKDNCIIINSSRGGVVDNNSLRKILKEKKLTAVLDVWENEPSIDTELLKSTEIGTPHIAGYSFEGKLNGTLMIYSSLAEFLGEKNRSNDWLSLSPRLAENSLNLIEGMNLTESLNSLVKKAYNIRRDDENLRKIINLPVNSRSSYFDQLRKEYPLRRELSNYTVKLKERNYELEKVLKAFRIKVEYI